MTRASASEALDRLYSLHCASLPMYLLYAAPWSADAQSPGLAVLRRIALDQQALADRIAALAIEMHGPVHHGGFPLAYTSLHDVSIDYLLSPLVQHQRRQIREIEQCVALLGDAPVAQALAEECLGYAKGHLESLEELRQAAPAGED